ncbi:MAG: OmpA family protein [Candidatus Adiutrix sp.]|jgi:outer membrane protein OmpA-like peptidoglycan-associated protein|nr:OmpA family protein [Candidatus Adiutrix sp.]
MKKLLALCLLLLLAMPAACTNMTKTQQGSVSGAAGGAAVGAVLGQAIGRNTQGTMIGAGIGAVVGGIAGTMIGSYMDQQEQQLRQLEEASIQRDQDVLTATFKGDFFFDFDSADLKPGAHSELDRVARVLNDFPQTTIRVEGHTDASGSAEYNQTLSERRALTVKNALVQRGVDPRRIEAAGYGKSRLISSSDAANRRVVIVIDPIRQG